MAWMATSATVGELWRDWRKRRGYSQLALALEADVSTRHVSYVENGRAAPSREMILVLATALEVPPGERNRLLLAGGYAPAYRDEGLDGAAAVHVQRAFSFLLQRHEPYPAVVVDPGWNVCLSNHAYARLMAFLGGQEPPPRPSTSIHTDPPVQGSNTVVPLFDPARLRAAVTNFDDIAPVMLAHVRSAARDYESARHTLIQLEAFDPPRRGRAPSSMPVVIPLEIERGDVRLSLFTSMTMLGTATDTVLAALRLEALFPATDTSDAVLREITDG